MINLKKLTCMILAAAMIITAASVDAFAGEIEGEIDLAVEDSETM